MEMFVLSYVNVLYVYPRLCLQVSSAWELRFRLWPDLTNQYVILIHYSPNLCKRNYLCSNLPFFKIQVNRFMAWDESSGAKIIPKCILWMRGLVPFWVLKHSFPSLTDWRQWHPTPVFLPGESHGRRSLVGYKSMGRKELEKTEQLHFTLFH